MSNHQLRPALAAMRAAIMAIDLVMLYEIRPIGGTIRSIVLVIAAFIFYYVGISKTSDSGRSAWPRRGPGHFPAPRSGRETYERPSGITS